MMLVSPSGVLAADAPEANPWASGEPASSSTPSTPVNTDWLTAAPTAPEPTPFDWLHPFQETLIPLNVWVDQGLDWLVDNFRPGVAERLGYQFLDSGALYRLTALAATQANIRISQSTAKKLRLPKLKQMATSR